MCANDCRLIAGVSVQSHKSLIACLEGGGWSRCADLYIGRRGGDDVEVEVEVEEDVEVEVEVEVVLNATHLG